jgi:hypothetical protein
MYFKHGYEINHHALIADMKRGLTVYRYHEEKSGQEKVINID